MGKWITNLKGPSNRIFLMFRWWWWVGLFYNHLALALVSSMHNVCSAYWATIGTQTPDWTLHKFTFPVAHPLEGKFVHSVSMMTSCSGDDESEHGMLAPILFLRCFLAENLPKPENSQNWMLQCWDSLRCTCSGWSIITVQLCQALGCIPVRHNWKILNRVLKKDEEGLGPKIPPRPSESLLKWDIVLAPEWLPKNNANAHCLYNTNCSTAVFSVHPNSIGAPPRQASCLISRLELRCIPIPGRITSHPTAQHLSVKRATRFWVRDSSDMIYEIWW